MNKKIILLLFILLFLVSCKPKESQVCFEKNCFYVDLAITEEEHNIGLMHRGYLEENRGILYIFDREDEYIFWMRNMSIATDIIWIHSNLTVVDIAKSATPCRGPICFSIIPEANATYVLEINANASDRIGLDIGSKAFIKIVNKTKTI